MSRPSLRLSLRAEFVGRSAQLRPPGDHHHRHPQRANPRGDMELEAFKKTIADSKATQRDASAEDKEQRKQEKIAPMTTKFDAVRRPRPRPRRLSCRTNSCISSVGLFPVKVRPAASNTREARGHRFRFRCGSVHAVTPSLCFAAALQTHRPSSTRPSTPWRKTVLTYRRHCRLRLPPCVALASVSAFAPSTSTTTSALSLLAVSVSSLLFPFPCLPHCFSCSPCALPYSSPYYQI